MKYIKLFDSIDSSLNTTQETPFVGCVKDINGKAMYAPSDKFGEQVKIVENRKGDFIKGYYPDLKYSATGSGTFGFNIYTDREHVDISISGAAPTPLFRIDTYDKISQSDASLETDGFSIFFARNSSGDTIIDGVNYYCFVYADFTMYTKTITNGVYTTGSMYDITNGEVSVFEMGDDYTLTIHLGETFTIKGYGQGDTPSFGFVLDREGEYDSVITYYYDSDNDIWAAEGALPLSYFEARPDCTTNVVINYDECKNDVVDFYDGIFKIDVAKQQVEYFLYENSTLTEIYIPESMTHLHISIFANCVSLRYIDIPSSVKYIGYDAFKKCTSLQSITIPSSVIHISSSAFDRCTNLTEIHYSGTAEGFPWGAPNANVTLIQD